jgi:hypothetical protein
VRLKDTKLGDRIIVRLPPHLERVTCTVIGKYEDRPHSHDDYTLLGLDDNEHISVSCRSARTNCAVACSDNLKIVDDVISWQRTRWVESYNSCEGAINIPTQKCIDCSIPLPHKKFNTIDKVICTLCKALNELG